MKCDTCIFNCSYRLGADEGGWMEIYCKKGHWHGNDAPTAERQLPEKDPWENCIDYTVKNNEDGKHM